MRHWFRRLAHALAAWFALANAAHAADSSEFWPEVNASPNFRYQVYLARQTDCLPSRTDLNALGLNFMWYH